MDDEPGGEMYYIDENGKKRDDWIHEEILGDDDGIRFKSLEEIETFGRKLKRATEAEDAVKELKESLKGKIPSKAQRDALKKKESAAKAARESADAYERSLRGKERVKSMSETPKLGRMVKVDLKHAWETEPRHFTPWLAKAENLKLLSETIDIELEFEAMEKQVGSFSADILCKVAGGNSRVVIENQLERTDHTHLGQLLTYASGLEEVKTVVWVARSFREEHRTALDWLNEATDDNFRFFGLEIELWRIGESEPAPKFNIVVQPNELRKITKQDPSGLQLIQRKYWGHLLKYMKRKLRPQSQNWQAFSIGKAGFSVNATRNSDKNRIGVELNITDKHAKAYFQILLRDKEAIEGKIGKPLEWASKEKYQKTSRIILYKDANPNDETDWPNQHEWIKKKVELFDEVFRERVRKLDPVD